MFKTHIHLAIFLLLTFSQGRILAQEWEFAKEKDGIKVYTRTEKDSRFKSFKGETDVKTDKKSIIALIEDVEKFDDWDEDVSEIRVLEYKPGKMLKYYVVYDVPWPFHDRDLCVEAVTSVDQATGTILVQARSIPEAVPLNDGRVRIMDYRQKWIVEQKENDRVHVTVEGFADPAGDIPAWIANMAITNTPLNMLRAIKNTIESP